MRLRLVVAAALLVSRVSSNAVLPSPDDFGWTIAIRQSDGLHALPYYQNGQAYLWLWTTDATRGTNLAIPGSINVHWPEAEFYKDGTVTVVDSTWNYTSGKATTFSMSDGSLTDSFLFGDDNTRWGGSLALSSGGLFYVNYIHAGPNYIFDVCYKRPFSPPAPGQALPSPWWTNRFSFPSVNGEIPTANYTLAELGGMVWIFITRDSSMMIALCRLKESNGTMVVLDWKGDYVSGASTNGVTDPMAIDGEFPDITARSDGTRIVLFYPGLQDRFFVCGSAYCRTVLGQVNSDYSHVLIQRTPYWMERSQGVAQWLRPNAIYFYQEVFDTMACTGGYQVRSTAGFQKPIDPRGTFATSSDGWLAHQGPTGFVIEKIPFQAKMKANKSSQVTKTQLQKMMDSIGTNAAIEVPQNVSVEWDNPTSNDTLQATGDFTNWDTVVTNAVSPVLLPAIGNKYFRVQQ